MAIRHVVGCVFVLALAACHSQPAAEETATMGSHADYADSGKQQAWITKSEDAIKAKLRDPDSAQFRNVEFHATGGIPVVCGEVNGNNALGGKAGYERFIAAGDQIDVLESDMTTPSELNPVWDKYCH